VRALEGRAEVLWIGGEGGMEASLIRRAGLPFQAVPAAGVHGVGLRALPGNLWRLTRGVAASRRILRRFRPDALLFTGGYVGVPVAIAGQGRPQVAYVPDIEPGLALRLLSRLADVVAVTAEETRSHLPARKKVVVTGYPTRPGLRAMDRDQACAHLGLNARQPVLLVAGGSRGARSINQAVWGCLTALLARTQLVHLVGELDWPEIAGVRQSLEPSLASGYHPHAYLHEEMGAALAAADLVISRAGASILGEYPLFGLPAVLVPYPHAWRYQKVNADYLVSRGAALLLEDSTLPQSLADVALGLLGDRPRLEAMAASARSLARPQAAQAIADQVEGLAGGRRRD
jgi:undecaprenyldiphospho-muramoylpentapeptide beta-N-acetylglucosaminyltransferase